MLWGFSSIFTALFINDMCNTGKLVLNCLPLPIKSDVLGFLFLTSFVTHSEI